MIIFFNTPNAGCLILGAGCLILGAGCLILDTGNGKIDRKTSGCFVSYIRYPQAY